MGRLRIAIIADQHGTLPEIPQCDLLVISGDITGGPDYIEGKWRPDISDHYWRIWLDTEFRNWLLYQPRTIAVAGNHDTSIERFGWPSIPNFTPLHDSGVKGIIGKNVWGAPWVRKYDQLAFSLFDSELDRQWGLVPNDTDIIISHHPPLGYGDNGLGCKAITEAIIRVKPKLVTCGHIHEGHGIYKLDKTTIVNASCRFEVIDI